MQSVMTTAWQIRRQAAAKFGIKVSLVDMGECLKMAWQVRRQRNIERNGNRWRNRVYIPASAYESCGVTFEMYARNRGVANVFVDGKYHSGSKVYESTLKQSYIDLDSGKWTLPQLATDLGIEKQIIKYMEA